MSSRALGLATAVSALAIAAAMALAAGQPIFTDDVWWRLAWGEAFAAHGPWLEADPLLFAAAGPPSPAAWGFDVAIHALREAFGFQGLRVLHVAWVAAILALVWRELRARGGAAWVGNLGVVVFVALAAYRLVQLRPHLFSMLAALALVRLLLRDASAPAWPRVAAAAAIAGVWANVHAAFLLAMVVIAAAIAGCVAFGDTGPRVRRLGAALALVALATLVNPSGLDAHLAYFVAGSETPALGAVVDEWAPFGLFRAPTSALPPSPLAWVLVWALVGGSVGATAHAWRTRRGAGDARVDPALVGVAWAGLVLLVGAVRFAWLGVFALALVASAMRTRARLAAPHSLARAAIVAGGAALVALAFFRFGDWPAITNALPAARAGYLRPYPPHKYFAHAVWFLRDAGLEGHLYTDYPLGGFAGYWLAPGVRTLHNGSLNVSQETLEAAAAIDARRGARPGESFEALLDRLGVDLFLGVRAPALAPTGRPWVSTTAHLEGAEGWVPIFRNLNSAVYLRANARNDANLAKAARHYARLGAPFDERRGFDVSAALDGAPAWVVARGVVPRGYAHFSISAANPHAPAGDAIRDRLAAVHAVLGLYERAVDADRARLDAAPDNARARRRLVWCLLRLRRFDEARAAADAFDDASDTDPLSATVARTAREIPGLPPEEREAALAALPLLTAPEVSWLMAGVAIPETRTARPR